VIFTDALGWSGSHGHWEFRLLSKGTQYFTITALSTAQPDQMIQGKVRSEFDIFADGDTRYY